MKLLFYLVYGLLLLMLVPLALELHKIYPFLPERLVFWIRLKLVVPQGIIALLVTEWPKPRKLQRLVTHIRLHRKAQAARALASIVPGLFDERMRHVAGAPVDIWDQLFERVQRVPHPGWKPVFGKLLFKPYDAKAVEEALAHYTKHIQIHQEALADVADIMRTWVEQHMATWTSARDAAYHAVPEQPDDTFVAAHIHRRLDELDTQLSALVQKIENEKNPERKVELLREFKYAVDDAVRFANSNPYEHLAAHLKASRAKRESRAPAP